MKPHIRLEHELLAVESEHRVHAMLELVAPDPEAGGTRPPLELALVIDRSGSMSGFKLEVTKQCARFLVRRLAPPDRLALVAYDDEVELLIPLVPVDQGAFAGAIDRLYPRGTTNLSGGWLKGAEQLRGGDGNASKKVMLLTDGLANVGVTGPSALVAMAEAQAKGGVGTTTIGFGQDFDEDLLTTMADAGRGNAHYARHTRRRPRHLRPGVRGAREPGGSERERRGAAVGRGRGARSAQRLPPGRRPWRRPAAARRRLRERTPASRLRVAHPGARSARRGHGWRGRTPLHVC